ncbi:VIT domain-containing protein [Pseudanabaena sp. PCC 6802]|uniref:VIT domain-containing protein n=1 Tax=Pseudanabaena sp. PCC 6802 TaxID=118173 RepID=UPI000368C2D5|nr:VIT domain-containing protein [Pseudanabaena sp. PCC 6802]
MKLGYALPTALLLTGVAVAHYTFAQSGRKMPNRIPTNPTIIQPGPEQVSGNQSDRSDAQNSKQSHANGLFVLDKEGRQQVFPLKHTDVKAKVAGNISRVEVTQTFQNPFDRPLEAIYVFPLPDEAAIDDMEIKIGDRIIKGDIKKRDEAKAIYEQARQRGQTAGLLDQERDNIFTQSLANIKPGEQINVTIRYTDSLKFEKGDYEFVFPMVVGPRYIPGQPISQEPETRSPNPNTTNPAPDTDLVPDASRITPPVLKPGTRSGHDINVKVEIDAGAPIADVRSISHQVILQSDADSRIAVKLAPTDTIPNKDLILRYRVAGEQLQSTVLTNTSDRGSHFATYLIPALEYRTEEIVPKDVVFLMDTSGSQSGDPLLKSQELMRRFIHGLNPNDTFTIIDFANTTRQLSSTPLQNSASNRQKALNYINQLDANGGTELLNGIDAVMKFPSPNEGRVRSIVLLTDGYIGNDNEVIAEVQKRLQPGNRLYAFGVGSSVNRFLLDRLAEVGRGTAQVVRQDEATEAVAEKFFRQINNPVLTNIQVQWEGTGPAPEIYPQAAPDLFANQPLVLFGRKQDRSSGKLRITGIAAGGKRYEKTLDVNFDRPANNTGIDQLWGRARIKDLMNQMFGNEIKSLVEAVTNTALSYRLLSQYTAFVAVSEEVRVQPNGKTERVQVPVELPQGVKFEGIYGNDAKDAATANVGTSSYIAKQRIVAAPVAPPPAPRFQPSPQLSQAKPTAAEPSITTDKPSPNQTPDQTTVRSRIQVVSLTGVTVAENTGITGKMPQQEQVRVYLIEPLMRHLQNLNVPTNLSGDIVLEFSVNNGRISSIILDDRASSLQDRASIDRLRRSLLSWAAPRSANGKARLVLRIAAR